MFRGKLKRGIKTCGECIACDENREVRWIDGHRRVVISYKCLGVAEPFTIDIDFKNLDEVTCTAYPDTNLKESEFNSLEDFVNLLTDKEKQELKKLLK